MNEQQTLLNEILMTPSNDTRHGEFVDANSDQMAGCDGSCDSGTCRFV